MVLPNTRYTQCSGDDSSPSNVAITTCVDERYHPPTCHPDRNEMEWRDLPKWQVFPYAGCFRYLGRFLHSADAAVGMTDVFCVGRYGFKCTTIPAYAGWRWVIAATLGSVYGVTPSTHTGCNCNVAGGKIAAPTDTPVGDTIQPQGLYSGRLPERHTGRSLRFR